jgi:hypothetical protein
MADKSRPSKLRDQPFSPHTVHVCVDMQRLFGEGTEWTLAWMPRVLPNIVAVCEAHAAQTIFTRFIPALRPGDGHGTWRRYYERWASMTLERVGRDMIEVVPQDIYSAGRNCRQARLFTMARLGPSRPPYRAQLRHARGDRRGDRRLCSVDGLGFCRLRISNDRRPGRIVQLIRCSARRAARSLQQPLWPAYRNGQH